MTSAWELFGFILHLFNPFTIIWCCRLRNLQFASGWVSGLDLAGNRGCRWSQHLNRCWSSWGSLAAARTLRSGLWATLRAGGHVAGTGCCSVSWIMLEPSRIGGGASRWLRLTISRIWSRWSWCPACPPCAVASVHLAVVGLYHLEASSQLRLFCYFELSKCFLWFLDHLMISYF